MDPDFIRELFSQFRPVTVDLNGRIAVRAKAVDQVQATELVLERSRTSGPAVRQVLADAGIHCVAVVVPDEATHIVTAIHTAAAASALVVQEPAGGLLPSPVSPVVTEYTVSAVAS